jgi:hypothetical protein
MVHSGSSDNALFNGQRTIYAQLCTDGERKWEGGREQVIAAPVGWEEGGGRQCRTFDEGIHSACPLIRKVFIDISSFIHQRSYLDGLLYLPVFDV